MQALVECEGDSIDMSGDMGAVGRVMISDSPAGHEMFLDLKGMLLVTSLETLLLDADHYFLWDLAVIAFTFSRFLISFALLVQVPCTKQQ